MKLKVLWDELNSIDVLPQCACGVVKEVTELNERNRLMQFLMGLNDVFEPVRNQILLQDPLPSINKAYLMAQKFETQKQVLSNFSEVKDSVAFFTKTQTQSQNFKRDQRDQRRYDPRKGHCTYCNLDDHTREGCFKLIGYPNWWQSKNKTTQ